MFRFREREGNDNNKEIITLYDLKFELKDEYFPKKKEYLAQKKEKLSKNQYYKIEDKKLEELEKVFKQVKTNIKLGFNLKRYLKNRGTSRILPEIIFNIKTKEERKYICMIYESKNFSKIIEIEIPDTFEFVEKLDNKDLIFITFKGKYYELLIYRLIQGQNNENKGYFLSQKIEETLGGYELKYNYTTNMFGDKKKGDPKNYELFYIKAISGNRFFCVSNYGFKMYALNEKNEYELVLLEPYEKIDFIYEIEANKFIFGLNLRRVEGYGFCGNAYTCYHNLFINKIELKDIDKIKNKSNNNNLKLKFSFISETMFEYHYSSSMAYDIEINFSDYVSLKNNYFIILVKNDILIFNIETGKEIKRFGIKADGCRYLLTDIKKWDCPENDEFILIVYNNVILIRLNEENSSKINLNILNYGYFPELCLKETKERTTFKKLKKINGQKNKFYSYADNCNDIIIYWFLSDLNK